MIDNLKLLLLLLVMFSNLLRSRLLSSSRMIVLVVSVAIARMASWGHLHLPPGWQLLCHNAPLVRAVPVRCIHVRTPLVVARIVLE